MPLSPGQLLHDRYWIRLMLGQGGMGAVYEGWDARLRLRCAIKENRIGDEAGLRQFEREAILLARLHHPNLPRVTDHFIVAGQGQYLVMDFVEGEDLKQRQVRLGPLPEADVLRWADHILNALAYLHKRGIIHRDIKPQNIKITPEGEAMLVDFGLAKDVATQGAQTITGAQGLTPGFAPPEQYKGGTDARTDVYSFGATLYNLLTGEVPPDALSRITEPEQFIPLARRTLNVSRPVAEAIDKALTIELKGRFASADEMRAALQLPTAQRATTTPTVETEALPRPVVSTEPAKTTPLPTGTGAPPMFTVKSIPRPERRQATQWGWVIGGVIALLALTGLVLGGLAGFGAFSSRTATPLASSRPTTGPSGPTLTPLPPTAIGPPTTPPPPPATATRVVRTATPTETPPPTNTPLPETATALAAIPSPAIGGLGRIAFTAFADGNPEIFTMNADGSGVTQLTHNKANDGFPAWSPDGKHIAFVSGRDGNNEIYVMNASGSGQSRLTNNPANDVLPVWSADGVHIAFISNRDGDNAIYVMIADGTGLFRSKLDLKVWEQPPDFASDGVRMVFASGRDGNAEIYTANQDGTGLTRLTNNPAADISPVWSPDNKRIVFVSKRDGSNEIYVMNADGSGQTRLTRSSAEDLSPSWSPDGARIAYVSIVSSSNARVYVMNADGSGQTPLANGFQAAWQP